LDKVTDFHPKISLTFPSEQMISLMAPFLAHINASIATSANLYWTTAANFFSTKLSQG
jgi:hypothetical protein